MGAALLDWIGADLASAGVTTLTCEVHPDNARSRRVFARAGFAFRFHDGSFVGQGPVSGHTDERTFMAFRLATTGS
jgi:RimJ/RimL family protein N-acetyltransferase